MGQISKRRVFCVQARFHLLYQNSFYVVATITRRDEEHVESREAEIPPNTTQAMIPPTLRERKTESITSPTQRWLNCFVSGFAGRSVSACCVRTPMWGSVCLLSVSPGPSDDPQAVLNNLSRITELLRNFSSLCLNQPADALWRLSTFLFSRPLSRGPALLKYNLQIPNLSKHYNTWKAPLVSTQCTLNTYGTISLLYLPGHRNIRSPAK